MIKRLIVGLFLLSGCSLSPVTVQGELMPDHLYRKIMLEENEIEFQTWFCPAKVDLIGELKNSYSHRIARWKVQTIADKECLKANISEDNLSYSIENLPVGHYTLAFVVTIPDVWVGMAKPYYYYSAVPVNIYSDRVIHLYKSDASLDTLD